MQPAPDAAVDADADAALVSLLRAAPRRFRDALRTAKAGGDTSAARAALAHTADVARAAARPCCVDVRCQCEVLAAEARLLGGSHSWPMGAAHVRTVAQAACFRSNVCAWLAARERLLLGRGAAKSPSPAAATAGGGGDDGFGGAAYLQYDPCRYDFHGLVCRMFAEHLPARDGDDDAEASLALLHASAAGSRELGLLSAARRWAREGLEYSRELDEATRYGCGVFNRVWKEQTALRDEFLALYERFVAEVIAPALGSPGLVYQAVPVFRVYMPHHLGVGPRHTDASYHAQPNELNFWVALTPCHNTNSLYVESSAGAADFEPIAGGVGTAYRFRGNACEHYSELNVSDATRVSFDFRVIREQELPRQPVPDSSGAGGERGAAEYFSVGRYYRRLPAAAAAPPPSGESAGVT